jgi:antirestriction protein ArdC
MSYQDEIRAQVTEKIVAALKSGQTPPWRRPWSSQGPALPTNISGRRYNGVNVILLMLAAMERNYPVNLWGTYNQFRNANGQVRKGSKGVTVILWKPVVRKKLKANGDEKESTFPVMRTFTVFNVAQVDGYPLPKPQTTPTEFQDYAPAEEAIQATEADIRYQGNRAAYSPDGDFIVMPPKTAFEKPHEFYGVVLHELCHWTGHKSRLDRLNKFARFGSESYAVEELTAELGSAMLSASLQVPQSDDLSNCQAYLASWIKVLESDHTAVFGASTQASLACDHILAFSNKAEAEEEEEAGELAAV